MTYAIIESGDKQFRVEKGMRLVVPELEAKEGSTLVFDRVLLCTNGDEVQVGTPTLSDTKVHARCLGPVQGKKLVVFKMRARKNSRRKTGHRQSYTQVEITNIESPLVPEEPEQNGEAEE
jgi:large subunit ribosomal protein L21